VVDNGDSEEDGGIMEKEKRTEKRGRIWCDVFTKLSLF